MLVNKSSEKHLRENKDKIMPGLGFDVRSPTFGETLYIRSLLLILHKTEA